MAASRLELQLQGLVTAPGLLAKAPGALSQASNVNFPAPGLAEKRKGFGAAKYGFGGACWSVITSRQLGDKVLFNIGSGAAATSLQYGTGAVVPTAVATPDGTDFANTPERRMKGAVALGNHYLTSSRAVGRLESDFRLYFAGMPRAPGMHRLQQSNAQLVAGTVDWLVDRFAVAYRVVWVAPDADGAELVSAPSGRWVVANNSTTNGYTGATLSPQLVVRIPFAADTTGKEILTTWKMRLYRSLAVDTATAQPNDEMQLCYESAPSSSDISAGYMTVVDSCPESALGAALYTNTVLGGESKASLIPGDTALGMVAANDRPPLCRDVASFADCMLYADVTTLQRATFSILATGAAGDVLKAGDQITIASRTYTATSSASPASGEFRVETSLGSVTLNLRQTAMNLVACINSDGDATVAVSYIGSDSSPGTIGRILVENLRSDGAQFTIIVSTGSGVPYLPQLGGTGLNSSQEAIRNGIAVSKPRQADAVPPVNYVRIGRNGAAVQRIIPLRDAVFIFTDDGVYWLRGDAPSGFYIESFDTTFRLLAREACVTCENAIFAWGREGIARITAGGVEYIDLPIRDYVEQVQRGLESSVTLEDFAQRAWAVAYQTQRRVVFAFPNGSETGGYACSRAFVFHTATGVWSTYSWDLDGNPASNGKTSGAVRWTDDLMVLGEWSAGSDTKLYVENNKNTSADFSDYDAGAGSMKPYSMALTWAAIVPGPSTLCHFSEVQVYLSPSPVDYTNPLPTSLLLGLTTEMGGSQVTSLTPSVPQVRSLVSPGCAMCTRMVVSLEHSTEQYASVSGFALVYSPMSGFVVR